MPSLHPAPAFVLRPPLPGDMGWVIEHHGALYAAEHGWNTAFEALVARIVAEMMAKHDPERERGWIAELNGSRVGSAFVVHKNESEAQLRLLLVSPTVRGMGLGALLTDACIAHARTLGYARLVLWTNANLIAARHLYASRGFSLLSSEPYHDYGHDLVGEQWQLVL